MLLVHLIHNAASAKRRDVVAGRKSEAPLTPEGEDSALLLGWTLKARSFSFLRVWCSTALRASTTAGIVLKPFDINADQVEFLPELEDRSEGDFEGKLKKEVLTAAVRQERKEDTDHWKAPGGESLKDVQDRMMLFVEEKILRWYTDYCERSPDRGTAPVEVAVFGHGLPFQILIGSLLGMPLRAARQLGLGDTSITTLCYTVKRGWNLTMLNDTSHLRGDEFRDLPKPVAIVRQLRLAEESNRSGHMPVVADDADAAADDIEEEEPARVANSGAHPTDEHVVHQSAGIKALKKIKKALRFFSRKTVPVHAFILPAHCLHAGGSGLELPPWPTWPGDSRDNAASTTKPKGVADYLQRMAVRQMTNEDRDMPLYKYVVNALNAGRINMPPPLDMTEFFQKADQTVLTNLVMNILNITNPHDIFMHGIEPSGAGTKGITGDPVLLVNDSHGEVIAVVKVFKTDDGFKHELAALWRLSKYLAGSPVVDVPDVLGAHFCQLPNEDMGGVIVMTRAMGAPLDDFMNNIGKPVAGTQERHERLVAFCEAVAGAAKAFAWLHRAGPSLNTTASVQYLSSFVGTVTDIIETITKHHRAALEPHHLEIDQVRERALSIIAAVLKNPGRARMVHGDAHPGNVFWDEVTKRCCFIDVSKLNLSMGYDGYPIGCADYDVCNFVHKLVQFGIGMNMNWPEIARVQELFKQEYLAAGGVMTGDAQDLFHLRCALGELMRGVKRGAVRNGVVKWLKIVCHLCPPVVPAPLPSPNPTPDVTPDRSANHSPEPMPALVVAGKTDMFLAVPGTPTVHVESSGEQAAEAMEMAEEYLGKEEDAEPEPPKVFPRQPSLTGNRGTPTRTPTKSNHSSSGSSSSPTVVRSVSGLSRSSSSFSASRRMTPVLERLKIDENWAKYAREAKNALAKAKRGTLRRSGTSITSMAARGGSTPSTPPPRAALSVMEKVHRSASEFFVAPAGVMSPVTPGRRIAERRAQSQPRRIGLKHTDTASLVDTLHEVNDNKPELLATPDRHKDIDLALDLPPPVDENRPDPFVGALDDNVLDLQEDEDGELRRVAAVYLHCHPDDLWLIYTHGDVHGMTPDKVYLVKRRAEREEQAPLVAVIKLFTRQDYYEREVAAGKFLREFGCDRAGARMRSPRVFAMQRAVSGDGKRGGVELMSVAPGTLVHDYGKLVGTCVAGGTMRRERLNEFKEAIVASAEALVFLHSQLAAGGPVTAKFSREYLDSFVDFRSGLQRVVEAGQFNDIGLPKADLEPILQHLSRVEAAYRADAGSATVVHGDYHIGNVFYESSTNTVTAIDVCKLDLSVDGRTPVGCPARDISNFQSKLWRYGTDAGLTGDEVRELCEAFLATYRAQGPPVLPDVLSFFMARAALAEVAGRGRPEQMNAPLMALCLPALRGHD